MSAVGVLGKRQWLWLSQLLLFAGICTIWISYSGSSTASLNVAIGKPNGQPSLSLTELPGYTGWARPASTLAGHFGVLRQDGIALVDQDWSIVLSCDGCLHHEMNMHPWFYVRAYGPAILTGIVEPFSAKEYKVTIHPLIVGQYWLEVVLTHSHPMDPDRFPLTDEQLPPSYFEGYILPGFPLQVTVAASTEQSSRNVPNVDYCQVNQLTIDESSLWEDNNSLWKQAAWRVTKTNRQTPFNELSTNGVTLRGYQWGNNSLGFEAAYEYRDCRLHDQLTESIDSSSCATTAVSTTNNNNNKLHIILIGDSVMRLQLKYLNQHLDEDTVDITFFELYGGALRCARLSGPYNKELISSQHEVHPRRTMILFNTGMHDIHRLCGHTYRDDRATYLTEQELQLPCVELYRIALRELAETVQSIPAAVRLFQTTTAAWPKYGNYGFAWDPRYAQELPLDAAFVERFNRIAVDELRRLNANSTAQKKIAMVDSYWMTLARPDNREINKEIVVGQKMSHPGYEVTAYIVRVWWQVATQLLLCRS